MSPTDDAETGVVAPPDAALPSVDERRIPVADGISLRVLVRRAALPGARRPPFLLVHGLASNARLWDGVARRLAASGHDAAAVDLRGHGGSDKPDDGYDFATVGQDLRLVVAGLGFGRPVLAGQSWGANVVLETAVRQPNLAAGLVLVDGAANTLADAFPSWQAVLERLTPPRLVGTPAADIERYLRSAHPDWPEEGIQGALANFEVRPDGTVAPWLSLDRHLAILRAMYEQRPRQLLAALRVPAVWISAETGDAAWSQSKRDGVTAAERALAAAGVACRVHWLSGDHDLHAQRPDAVVEIILRAVADGLFGPPASSVQSCAEPPA